LSELFPSTTFTLPALGTGSARLRRDPTLTDISPAAHQVANPVGRNAHPAGHPDSNVLLSTIVASLEEDKAEDVVTIPLAGKSEMADHMVVASGRSSRQVSAICEHLVERLKHDQGVLCRTEGKELGDWVLIDAGDVVVHVFRPEVRSFYQLEKMWLPQPAAERRAADGA
jgi:ribosome-associated protein